MTISIPSGGDDRRRLDRGQVEGEQRVPSDLDEAAAARPVERVGVDLLDGPLQLRVAEARAPRPRALREAPSRRRGRARRRRRGSPRGRRRRANASRRSRSPRRRRRPSSEARSQLGLARLALPVEVPLDRVGLVERRPHRRDPAAELVLVDLADLRHGAEPRPCVSSQSARGVGSRRGSTATKEVARAQRFADRERDRLRARARAARAARLRPPRSARVDRDERRVRHVVVRRLHRPRRRRVGEVVHAARRPGRRRRDHDDRGARDERRAPSRAAGVPRPPRAPVRLLHAGDGDGRRLADRGGRRDERGGDPRGARGQPLPLHRLPQHRRRRVRAPRARWGGRHERDRGNDGVHRRAGQAPGGRAAPHRARHVRRQHDARRDRLHGGRPQPVRARARRQDRSRRGPVGRRRPRRLLGGRPPGRLEGGDAVRLAGHRGHEEPAALPA